MEYIHLHLSLFLLSAYALNVLAASHPILNKRDPRAILIWIGFCIFLPLGGSLLYWTFGVNRIRTHARRLHHRGGWSHGTAIDRHHWPSPSRLDRGGGVEYGPLRKLSDSVTRRPLLQGNRITVLSTGEEAYAAMRAAIRAARRSVFLSTYIFDADTTGMAFVQDLAAAAKRGLRVRVLVDGLGEKYSPRPISRILTDAGVRCARFLPVEWRLHRMHLNLRNHRKILVTDNLLGFLGGMNIRDAHNSGYARAVGRIQDLHFKVEGPAAWEMQEVFLEDWYFTTRESLPWPSRPQRASPGSSVCRVISDGPNEDFEKFHHLLLGIMAWARKRLRIMTPYFVPDRVVIAGLQHAALRGVKVEIILPAVNNLPFVAWASRAYLWELLQRGIQVFEQPGPFAHGKALTADGAYSLVGSSNIDSRSLRLNFESNLEVYDPAFTRILDRKFDLTLEKSRRLTLERINGEPLPARFRNAVFKVLSPYL